VIVDFSLTPVKNEAGAVVFLVPEGRDITERKEAENERQRLEDELRRQLGEKAFLAELGAILASSLDHEERLLDAGQLLVNFMGDFCSVYLIEEDAVRRLKVLAALPENRWIAENLSQYPLDPQSLEPVWSILKFCKPQLIPYVPEQELTKTAQDDAQLRLFRAMNPRSILGVPLLARDRLLGALVLVSSRAERSYSDHDVELAMEVARRSAVYVDNARLYRDAQEATRARDEVLGIVAHDLRNPIHSIELSAAILRARLEPGCQGRVEDKVESILASAERAHRLIRDLLDVSRVVDGQLTLTKEPIALQELLRETLREHEVLVREASLRLQVDIPTFLPTVFVDRDRLLQVFDNLFSNAIKFTAAPGMISVGAAEHADEVLFWVRDTGAGISQENLPHLFNRFWQGRRGDRRGAGLGLSIAKAVVEAHGGRIWVESTVGIGSSFYVALPVA
jgi:signal transduction histidine kinase